ncbi:MAG: sulfotransferase [bacterium]
MASKLLTKLFVPEASGRWFLPRAAYGLTRAVHALRPVLRGLSGLETALNRRALRAVAIDRPVYVCGIARAGTTITLELLHRHPVAATHRYYNLPLPYLPHWGTRLIEALPLAEHDGVERVHADRLKVTRRSPEAVEERLWMCYFEHLHDERRSNVLDAGTVSPAFERFYRDHIRKLLLTQGRTRYLVKNNYNVTRLAYLRRLFPDARFLLIVRDPVAHLASLMKQHRLFMKLCAEDKRMLESISIVGHFEFGPRMAFVNVGDGALGRIRDHWAQGRQVAAWATYWASLYGFLADGLDADSALAAATRVVRYEDLCRDSAQTIDALLRHIGFAAEPFREIKARYVESLSEPRYYQHGFTEQDLATIRQITADVAGRFGYDAAG